MLSGSENTYTFSPPRVSQMYQYVITGYYAVVKAQVKGQTRPQCTVTMASLESKEKEMVCTKERKWTYNERKKTVVQFSIHSTL